MVQLEEELAQLFSAQPYKCKKDPRLIPRCDLKS